MKNVLGGCLCGQVRFEVKDDFKRFYQCHCKQCQQLTGSAFAANLFTHSDNVKWLQGENSVRKYEDQARDFSKAFCQDCGSALPFVTKNGEALIVPAGSLDQAPDFPLQAKIFVSEAQSWLHGDEGVVEFSGLPK